MDARLVEPYTLFATERELFLEKYQDNPLLIAAITDVFLLSESRPQQAEHIAIKMMGHEIHHDKKYDGMIVSQDGTFLRYSEYKVTCRRSNDGEISKISGVSINDVSQTILDRYIQDQPLFVFPFFVDGHLVAMFSVDFCVIRDEYERFLSRHAAKTEKGRASFKLATSAWSDRCKIEYVHKNLELIRELPPVLQTRIYHTLPPQGELMNCQVIAFPTDHKFYGYGYNFTTERIVSYKVNPAGADRKERGGITINKVYYAQLEFRNAAAALSTGTVVAQVTSLPKEPRSSSAKPQKAPSSNGTFQVTVTYEFPETMSMAEVKRKLNIGDAELKITVA